MSRTNYHYSFQDDKGHNHSGTHYANSKAEVRAYVKRMYHNRGVHGLEVWE